MGLAKRDTAICLLSILVTASLVFVVLNMRDDTHKTQEADSFGSSIQGTALAAPPNEAVEATSTTPPLNTSEISLIAYYQTTLGWILADTLPAFVSHVDGGNYIDGRVRVWDSGNIGASGTRTYVDVRVRVRADGWIISWFKQVEDDPGALVYWGHGVDGIGPPPQYSTTLSRAIEIVYNVTGMGFPGHNMIGLYDYSKPSASRLLIFGKSTAASGANYYYYTIPSNSTMVPITLLVRAGGIVQSGQSCGLHVDDQTVYYYDHGYWGWLTFETDAFGKGIQHSIEQWQGPGCKSSVAFIMWSG